MSVDRPIEKCPELSVVVLCYRAEYYISDFIAQLERELTEAELDFELILVANFDKGTDDKTPDVVKALSEGKKHFRVVSEAKEGRMGWDMRSGLEAAKGDNIAVIDGDGQMPTSDVVKVYKVLKTSDFDLVKTYRMVRHDGFYRSTLSKIYNWSFNLLFRNHYSVHDVNSKPKVMTRKAYEELELVSNDWFTDAEIMIEAIKHKQRIGEIATVFYKNERRKTFVSTNTIFEFIVNLTYYRFIK